MLKKKTLESIKKKWSECTLWRKLVKVSLIKGIIVLSQFFTYQPEMNELEFFVTTNFVVSLSL